MLSALYKLKAKKGFTLVELIVVIAIIGILAAILIPIMLDYTTASKIQSLNHTASTMKNCVHTWFMYMDAHEFNVKRAASGWFLIDVTAVGTFTVSEGNFDASGGDAAIDGFFNKPPLHSAQDLTDLLNETFPQIKTGAQLRIEMANGTVEGALYAASALPASIMWSAANQKWVDSATALKDGVASNGTMFGSYPIHTIL